MSANDLHFGRTEAEWQELEREGLRFLLERVRLGKTTSYREMNTTLGARCDVPTFDFSLEHDRAAMGHLLFRIVERDRAQHDRMLSAIVLYLNGNEPGTGFYRLAEQYGLISPQTTPDQKLAFWAAQAAKVFER